MDPRLVENISSQENLALTPKVKYEIYFSPHGNPDDFRELFGRIKDADIYIPEVHGWTMEHLQMYRDVSSGKKSVEQAIQDRVHDFSDINPLLIEELQAIEGTNKKIVFIDLPEQDVPAGHNRIFLGARDFSGLLANTRHHLEESSKSYHKREAHMLEQLKLEINKLLEEYPELKEQGEVKVLLSLGSVHTGVYYKLKEEGEDVERKFNIMPHIYSLKDEGVRRYMLGKEVDDHLASQILLETVFENVFQTDLERISTDNMKIDMFKRKIASSFNIDEIRDILRLLTYTDWNYFKGSFESYMVYKMREKGLKLPGSEEELSEMVKLKESFGIQSD